MKTVFIGGAPRSGTTFLGSLVGGHSACIATPESSFKVDGLIARVSQGRVIDATAIERLLESGRFRAWGLQLEKGEYEDLKRTGTVLQAMSVIVQAYARRSKIEGPSVWVDHTPSNIRHVDRLLKSFPETKFVHLIRDGRAVCASVLPLDWGPNTVVAAARDWMEHLAAGLAAESSLPADRIVRVRYEDLVAAPEQELRRLCKFLELDYEDSMMKGTGFTPEDFSRSIHPLVGQPPRSQRISAWRSEMQPRDIEIFEARTGDLLPFLGYELEFRWEARGPTFLEMFRMYLGEGGIRARNKAVFRRHLQRYARKGTPR